MPLKLYRPEGSYVWYYDGTVAGHRLRGSTRTKDRKIAARLVSKIENDHYERRLDGPEETLTFPQAVALYIKAGKLPSLPVKPHKKPRRSREEKYIDKLEDHWKDTKIKDITPGAIRQSAIDLYPDASGATRNRQVITPTQAIINHCAELELCPPIRVKRFKFEKKIKKPVTVDWLDAFCAHADHQMAALATFMFATGCRISEAMRLQWDDIDFSNRRILIRKTKNKRQRLPHMPQRLLVALANLPREKGPFDAPETSLRRAWDAVVEKAGIERLTFHSCRHGLATKLLRDGVDPKTAASLGGWESIGLFMETYAHAIEDATLTDLLFDKSASNSKAKSKKNNSLGE